MHALTERTRCNLPLLALHSHSHTCTCTCTCTPSHSNSWMAKRRLHHRVWYAPEKTSCWPEASAHLERLNTRLTSIKLGYLACLLPYFKRSVAFCQQLLITGDIKHAILDQKEKDDDTDVNGAGGASGGEGGGKWKSISLVINTNYTDTRRPTQKKQKGSEWRRLKLRYNIDELTPDLKNFRRLIRTTCGFGLHSETKDPVRAVHTFYLSCRAAVFPTVALIVTEASHTRSPSLSLSSFLPIMFRTSKLSTP